ncbi:MAG: chromosome segregation protein SMC [Sporolactobacillus sp.]
MYLKRLDVSGFKSFADKTSIEFVPGVTAVVGPNGSGKSNITEAIRWVLGEQSAKSLRGSKMEDIIFSGSDARKAVNLAEVTLILDNHDHYLNLDFSELSVTRRVFRSGDSEFLLNGQSCRLKDIIDLFLDSGLGKEAYSVIGQGKIDEILNSKAEDKRRIFEEASGVLKYKLRKQAAEKQLDESQDNLSRVEDILHELHARLGPLEEQAALAKDYMEKKATLKQIDVGLLAYDIEKMHRDWSQAQAKSSRLKQRKQELSKQIEDNEGQSATDREALDKLEQDIDGLQNAWAEHGERLEKLLGQKELLAERKRHAESTSEDLNDRLRQVTQQLEDLRRENAASETNYQQQKQRLHALQQQLTEKEQLYTNFSENLAAQIEAVNTDYVETLNQQAALRNEQRYLTEQSQSLSAKKQRTASDAEGIRQQLQDAQAKRQLIEEKLAEHTQECDELRLRHKEQQHTLDQDKARYVQQKAATDKLDRLIDQAASRKEMLEALQEDYAGFFQGVREILKHKRELRGVHGAVAELIHIAAVHQLAIETALGGSAQSIIVADEASGREAIRFLRKSQAGRATFLPLTIMKPRQISTSDRHLLEESSAFVGCADTLVNCDALYRPIISHLLGSVIIALTLEGANQLAKALHYRYRIVTLEGDVVAPGGSMTGGSTKANRSSILSRSTELETLKQQLNDMQAKRSAAEKTFSALKMRIAAEELDTDRLRQAQSEAEERCRTLEAQLGQSRAEERSGMDAYQLITREHTDFTSEQEKIQNRLHEISSQLDQAKRQIIQLTSNRTQLACQQKNREQTRASLQEEITMIKVDVANQSQISARLKEICKQASDKLAELAATREALEQSVANVSETIGDHALSADSLDKQTEQARRCKESAANQLEAAKAARHQLQSQLAECDAALTNQRQQLNVTAGELEREEVAANRLDVALDHMIAALREDYELTVEAARDHYPLTLDPEAARRQVKLIKRAIDELGTVNLGAIDEYQQVSTRAQFLAEQRDDLLQARANLENVMTEMDEEVSSRFAKTFAQIRTQFRSVFAELFGGGQADLKLLDPEDLLTSGIDILAEPPGKKLQKLSLLSGGERALTATALLFAILKVRPVPFCVLDEVEAALDDANVDRYAAFLQKFSADTQFIVVTHRHGTMEHANVLYGVTMQESGISRLVSVRLEETEALLQTDTAGAS